MRTTRFAIALPLLAFAFGACDCGEELQVLAPKIEIGDPYDATFSVCQDDFIRECTYDFGEVGIGRPKLFSFAIKNPTPVDLTIHGIKLEGPTAFTLEGELPKEVASNSLDGEIVTIKYDPTVENSESAQVIIESDAQNLLADENVVIDLIGTGKNLGAPVIVVDPATVDFGDVGVGVRAVSQLTIRNDGNLELEVSGVEFTPDTPAPDVFGNDGPFPIPAYVAPGTATSISFYAVPNRSDQITGSLLVHSNDPARPTVEVPFVVRGAQAPTAIARVKSINGTPNSSATPSIEPLDNVIISGDESVGGSGGAVVVAYQWQIVEQPPESSVTLSSPNAVDTGFQFSSATGNVQGLDVAGTFVVRLTVTDSNNAVSTNEGTITLNAIPTDGLHVQLSWSSADYDIDLHVGKGNAPDWCSQDDCYYANCTEGDFSPPNWDGGGTGGLGDPTLDIDDLDGFGPENTNIDTPVNGSYVVGVHAYTLSAPGTDVTVKIFLGGALAGEFTTHFDADNDWWDVARIDVNGSASVVPIDTQSNNFSCF